MGVICAVVNRIQHISIGNLAHQLIPGGVFVACFHKIDGFQCPTGTALRQSSPLPIQRLHFLHNGGTFFGIVGQAVRPHGIGHAQTLGGGKRSLPVVAAEVGHGLPLRTRILIQVGILKQVCDGIAGVSGHGISGAVQLIQCPGCGQGCIAGAAHAGSVCALCHQDVVHSVVGIRGNGEIVVTGIHDIGLCQIAVVTGQVILADFNSKVLRFPCRNFLLVKAAQLHRRLFYPVVNVILGVGRLEINLHGVLAIHLTGVGHIHLGKDGASLVGNLKIRIIKGGIAQAAAKGEGHQLVIIIVPCIPPPQHIVLVPGLEVAVAHIDALLIDDIILIALVDAGSSVILGCRQPQFRRIGIGIGIVVLHGRGSMVILLEGVHNPTGRVHLACQDVRHRRDTVESQIAHPQQGIDVIVVNEVQL